MRVNNQPEDLLEAELRRLRPARAPAKLLERLDAAKVLLRSSGQETLSASRLSRSQDARANAASALDAEPAARLRRWLRWLVPAGAVAIVVSLVWALNLSGTRAKRHLEAASNPAAVKADDVQINQELVSAFDAVASLPSGEPVRFRCQQWMDEVVLQDTKRGVVIERRTPRLEIMPVSFETY